MSFTCCFCGQPQGPGIKPEKIITKTRLIITKIVQNPFMACTEGRDEIFEEKIACAKCAAERAQKGFKPEVAEVRLGPGV